MTGLGAFGEAWAVGYLTRLGYRIIARNVRYRVGEIDIVAWDGPVLAFIEVKCRRTGAYGTPEESITPARFARLAAAIDEYLQRNQLEPKEFRVDVVSIVVDGSGRVAEHRLLKGVESPS